MIETGSTYSYSGEYPYLIDLLQKTGGFRHNFRVAVREYTRVFFPLQLRPGDTLLDVGCCIGQLGHYFKYAGVNTHGIDLNLAALRSGKKLYGKEPRNTSIAADAGYLPYEDSSFDAVVSQDIYEHLTSMAHAIHSFKEMERVLKRGKNRMFHKITVLEDEQHINADESHVLKWTSEEWSRFFRNLGWKTIHNPSRKFPIASNLSHGNFLIEREI